MVTDWENGQWLESENYTTELGDINGIETMEILSNQSAFYSITKTDVFNEKSNPDEPHSAFVLDRYLSEIFQGIIPDSRAAGVSTAGEPQVTALQKLQLSLRIDTTTASNHKIRFGKGDALSQGTIKVDTPVGLITFHVVLTSTPFLFCLQDMDRLRVRLDNLTNELI
jgi:hypothetical protein